VALGAEKGQAWIQKNRQSLNAPIISHLGAVINFIAGNVSRSPVIWARLGFEWIWRIIQEPRLWRRYFSDGLAFIRLLIFNVLPLALYDRWLKRSGILNVPSSISYASTDNCVISISGSVHHAALDPIKQSLDNVLENNKQDVILNCSELVYIDSAFIGSLMLFQRFLSEQHRTLYLQNVPPRISRLLRLHLGRGSKLLWAKFYSIINI